jgi:hypothetical protein
MPPIVQTHDDDSEAIEDARWYAFAHVEAEGLFKFAQRLSTVVTIVTILNVIGTVVLVAASVKVHALLGVAAPAALSTLLVWIGGNFVSRWGRTYAADVMQRTH